VRRQLGDDAERTPNVELGRFVNEACDVLGVPRGNLRLAASGRNMGALIVGEGSQAFVFKSYGPPSFDGIQRFIREVSFLRWGSSVALHSIPELLYVSRKNRWIATNKLIGRELEGVEDSHMDLAGEFVVRLAGSPLGFPQKMLPARERLVSPDRLAKQLTTKWRRTQSALTETDGTSHILGTLNTVLGDYMQRKVRLDLIELDHFLGRLAKRWKTTVMCSPSDFGLHNCLENRSGQNLSLSFLDFEYAGVDHPLKLVLDFLVQPDFPLTERHQDRFLEGLRSHFPLVLEDIPPSIWRLFVSKWMLIVGRAEAKSLLSSRDSFGLPRGNLNGYLARYGGFFG